MNLKAILQTTEKLLIDNSPGILTGLGVAGAVTTVALTGREAFRVGMDASTQYHEALREDEPLPKQLLETKYLIKTYWKGFIPPAIVLSATIASIVAANHIGSRRAAAIAAAYKISEKLSEEYREQVVKTLGGKNEEKMRAEMMTEKVSKTPGHDLIFVAGAESVFFDDWSGRYFKNDLESVRKAVNDLNYQVNNHYYASLSDFYRLIGLTETSSSDDMGWNSDNLLEVRFTPIILPAPDNRPAIAIHYDTTPIRGYDRCQ